MLLYYAASPLEMHTAAQNGESLVNQTQDCPQQERSAVYCNGR